MRAILASLVVITILLTAGCSKAPEAPPAAAAGTPPAAASAPAAPPAELAGLPAAPTLPAAETFKDLAARVTALGTSGDLSLPPGEYILIPIKGSDGACATCMGADWQDERPGMTYGLRIEGKGIRIAGAGADRTIIRTRAGYGLLFDGCEDCELSGVTVTGGERDLDDRATDAAVVVRNGRVTISDCVMQDNLGAEFVVKEIFTGIAGVVVREGAEVTLQRCRILRSSWDGVSVLRGGKAVLRDVVIDGVDRAQGQAMGGGRGVGIRLAWGASLQGRDVLIARHDGGLGVYGNSSAELRDSVIEDSPSWGVAARPDASGAPQVVLENVGVHRTTACGVTVRGEGTAMPTGRLTGVRLALTAQGGATAAGYCPAVSLDAPGFDVTDTLSWRTGGSTVEGPGDAPTDAFRAQAAALAGVLAGLPATGESAFVQSFGHAAR